MRMGQTMPDKCQHCQGSGTVHCTECSEGKYSYVAGVFPNTQVVTQVCSVCSGTLDMVCYICDGTGREAAPERAESITLTRLCEECGGTGMQPCGACDGNGSLQDGMCATCYGSGQGDFHCRLCNGQGFVKVK